MIGILARLSAELIKGLSKLAAPFLAYLKGRKDKQADIDKEDAEILKKQRDNNVVSVDDADKLWSNIRKDKGK